MTDEQTISVVTPTYPRQSRVDYLKRCISTFRKVERFLWIVVEDGDRIDEGVRRLLDESGIRHVYLHFGPTRCWGNDQRNAGLEYIKCERLKGIVYMADDDNQYDVRLFDQLRKTKRISIVPVGNLGPNGIERPLVLGGKITGWDALWMEREFPIDMAGFAFNADMLHNIEGKLFDYGGRGGESEFLSKLIASRDEMEPICRNCTRCCVWHNQPLGVHPLWNDLFYRLRYLLRRGEKSLRRLYLRLTRTMRLDGK